jgi:hypothetical protein
VASAFMVRDLGCVARPFACNERRAVDAAAASLAFWFWRFAGPELSAAVDLPSPTRGFQSWGQRRDPLCPQQATKALSRASGSWLRVNSSEIARSRRQRNSAIVE